MKSRLLRKLRREAEGKYRIIEDNNLYKLQEFNSICIGWLSSGLIDDEFILKEVRNKMMIDYILNKINNMRLSRSYFKIKK